MTRSTRRWGTALAATTLLCGSSVGPVAAESPEQPFYVEVVSGPTFTTHPDRLHLVARIHIPPGGYVDWHKHPGYSTVTIEGDGTFTLMRQSCRTQELTAGETFVAPSETHTARNLSDEWVTGLATFAVRGAAPTVFADPATDDRLDARCGLEE